MSDFFSFNLIFFFSEYGREFTINTRNTGSFKAKKVDFVIEEVVRLHFCPKSGAGRQTK